ncbi:MAG: GNAT family protein [Meiothermus sp.]|nr:GNAT family protein [Meiothermus sp.]
MLRFPLDEHGELRLLLPQHAEALFDLTDRNRAHLRRWLPWVDGVLEPADTATFIQGRLDALARGTGFDLTIWQRGQIAGTVGLFDLNGFKGEIGYWLGQGFEGQGLMSRSVSALLDYGFGELGLARVQIKAHTENLRSRAVPERLGFRLEGVLKNDAKLHGNLGDHALYAMTSLEWVRR